MSGIRRAQSLGEQLASELRRQIVSGQLGPQTHLVEDSLAELHDISRGPVRDALRILSAEGLIEDRRRGFFVKPFSPADIEELYSLRLSIESLACSLALTKAPASAWSTAAACVRDMSELAGRQDWQGFSIADLAFHSEFYNLSGHQRLQSLWRQYRPTFGALLEVAGRNIDDLRPSAEDHEALLTAAQQGREKDLLAALQLHLEGSKNRMIAALEPVWSQGVS